MRFCVYGERESILLYCCVIREGVRENERDREMEMYREVGREIQLSVSSCAIVLLDWVVYVCVVYISVCIEEDNLFS